MGGTDVTLGLAGSSRCPQQMSLPSLSPARWLGLVSGVAAVGSALLPACLPWGARGRNSPAGDLDQNVLKVFPQIVSFNFNKSCLVALRTLAVGEGMVRP